MYRSSIPQVDLHGMDREFARITTEEFLEDQFIIGNREVVIIHGIGTGILKKEVHDVLKHHKLVETYKLDNFNSGMTIVILKNNLTK